MNSIKPDFNESCIIELGTLFSAKTLFNEQKTYSNNDKKRKSEVDRNISDILNLLQLNVLFEAVCLYEKVIIIYCEFLGGQSIAFINEIMNSNYFTKELINKKLISFVEMSDINIENDDLFLEIWASAVYKSKNAALYEFVPYKAILYNELIGRCIGSNNLKGLKGIDLKRTKDFFAKYVEDVNNNTNSNYYPGIFRTHTYGGRHDMKFQLYKHLEKIFKEKINDLRQINYCVPLFIPPISTLIFNRANSKENIIIELMHLREEFASFRRLYSSYQNSIRNSSNLTLKEMLKIREENYLKVINELDRISKRKHSNFLFEILTAGMEIDKENNTDVSFGFDISTLIKIAKKGYHISKLKGKANILFDMYSHLNDVREYHKLYRNIFKIDINENNLKKIAKYSKYVNEYLAFPS